MYEEEFDTVMVPQLQSSYLYWTISGSIVITGSIPLMLARRKSRYPDDWLQCKAGQAPLNEADLFSRIIYYTASQYSAQLVSTPQPASTPYSLLVHHTAC